MLEGKRVLLIDDFYTTGSTARECQQALLAASPREVIFLAFAAK
jgi:predicted amidophosphoribosyltransferase